MKLIETGLIRYFFKGAVTEADKDRLAKIMAFGKDSENWPKPYIHEEEEEYEPEPEMDRFDECKINLDIKLKFKL